MQVMSRRNANSGINFDVWTNMGGDSVNASDPRSPVMIFARLTHSRSPVVNAKVTAILQRLGHNETGGSYDPLFVELKDNGNGGMYYIYYVLYLFYRKIYRSTLGLGGQHVALG